MADTARDAKLTQYLNEAYAKEKELETALTAHIGMTTRKAYEKRLREHLKETKARAPARAPHQADQRWGAGDRRGGGGPGVGPRKVAHQGPAPHGQGRRGSREDAEEREDRVLQRARGDRDLHRDRGPGGRGRRHRDREAGPSDPS